MARTEQSSAVPRSVNRILDGIVEAFVGITPEIKERFGKEDLCSRCGECCHASIRLKKTMVLLPDLPCKFLSRLPDGRTYCTVYPIRDLTGWCREISAESVRRELFPPQCPYVAGLANYGGKIKLEGQEFEKLIPDLRKIFKGFSRPEYVREEDWRRFKQKTLGLPAGS